MAKGSKHGGIEGLLVGWVLCLWCPSITPSTALPVPRTDGIAPEQALEDESVADNTTEWLEVCTTACDARDHARAAAQSQQRLQAQQPGSATASYRYVP